MKANVLAIAQVINITLGCLMTIGSVLTGKGNPIKSPISVIIF